jgi:ketosteroid isomerase-like protein
MSQENVETIQRLVAAWIADDLDAYLAELDAEIEWYPSIEPGLEGKATVFRGHDDVRRAWDDVVDETWYSPEEVIEAGDQVVVVLRWGGRGKGSGVGFEERGETWVFSVHDGKIMRVREYASKKEALEAAGLSE